MRARARSRSLPIPRIREGLTYDDVLLIPKRSPLSTRRDADTTTFLTPSLKLRIPIVAANMDTVCEGRMAAAIAALGGIGIIHRFLPVDRQADEVARVKKENKSFLVGAAVGVREDSLERTRALLGAGCDVIVIDIAHGHSDHTIETVRTLRRKYGKLAIIAGNVATAEGTADLLRAGASGIKVGIGPGSLCTTRVVAGCGVPQLTAVMDCVAVARKYRIPVIADGGVKQPGDLTKALAAGASTVMIGGMFAGCEESPGIALHKNGGKYKLTRGMASLDANRARRRANGQSDDFGLAEYVAEGIEALVPYRGSLAEVVNQLLGGLRSGMSYCGSRTIAELWKKAEFIRITQAGLVESHPHDVKPI